MEARIQTLGEVTDIISEATGMSVWRCESLAEKILKKIEA